MPTLEASSDSPSLAPSPVAAGFVHSIPPTDGELLVRFTRRGDTAAFAQLVESHAPLVLSVCRQVLRRPADVDDAFQATFMILAKRAGDIRASDSAAGWLYRVAYRTSVALARRNKARPEEPLNGHDFVSPECDPLDRIHQQHSVAVMIEELRALPARYQEPLVLCYLEGHSRSRAAEMLDSTTATIKGRLARGKQLLRHRLARRGVALSIAAGIASSMVESAHAAASSTMLGTETAHAASQFVSSTGAASSGASSVACSLAQNGVSAMLYASLAKPALAALAVLALGAGAVLATDPAPESPSVAIGGMTLQATAAEAMSGEESIPAISIEASATADTAVAQAHPMGPTITVRGKPREPMMASPTQPRVSQWTSGPTQFGGFVDVTASRPAESDQPSVEELQLEMRYWETRAEGLEQKSKAIQKKYDVINAQFADGTTSPQELAEASIELGEATLMRAEVFQAKAKMLEMKRKIAAREKQASAPAQRDVTIEQRRGLAVPSGATGNWSDMPAATMRGVPAQPPTPPSPPVSSSLNIYGPPLPPQRVMPPNAFGVAAPAQPAELRVFWQSDIDAALDIAKRDGRRVVVHVEDPADPRSQKLTKMVEGSPEIKRQLHFHTVPVKISVQKHPEVVDALKIVKLPTVCIFTAEGEMLDQFAAPQLAESYFIKLKKLEAPQSVRGVHSEEKGGPSKRTTPPSETTNVYRSDDGLRPGDEVKVQIVWKHPHPSEDFTECLNEYGHIRFPYGQGSVRIDGPVGEAAKKIEDELRATFRDRLKDLVSEVIVQPTGRRKSVYTSGGDALPDGASLPTTTSSPAPTTFPNPSPTPPAPSQSTIDPSEVAELKQEIKALRKENDALLDWMNSREKKGEVEENEGSNSDPGPTAQGASDSDLPEANPALRNRS